MTHPHVPHPRDLVTHERTVFAGINRALTTTLGSNAVFLACFIVPLLAVPASETVKLIVAIVFSNWFQAWALPVLQKSSDRAEAQRAAKADADHAALTHVAVAVDALLDGQARIATTLAAANGPTKESPR